MKKERLGQINKNKFGTEMKIIKYNTNHDIWVEFQDEYKAKVHTEYKHFKNGSVKNPYDKEVCGIGYYGQGKYKSRENNKITDVYRRWKNMLERCYDPYVINKDSNLTYADCFVCEEWLCFQNFAEWWYKNVYNCNNERMELDKDILIKGNKIYSPETCLIVPQRINTLFIKQQRKRGEYPIGICTYCNKEYKYLRVQCNTLEKKESLGYFPIDKPFQAFTCYKNFKENYIKQVADEYKDLIPTKLYEALYKWEVEIND